MLYNGYDAGTTPYVQLGQRLLDAGFALFSVQVRGTGCSSGPFRAFERAWAEDGARAVEWAARQPWSTGRVGMYGVSFSAFMQLYTAAERPSHLAAIMPAGLTGSFYRDAVYPGGIFEAGFPSVFGKVVLARNRSSLQSAQQQHDTTCAGNAAQHPAATGLDALYGEFRRHPYLDRYWTNDIVPPAGAFRRDSVPTLIENAWQDEIVGGTWANSYNLLPRTRTWYIVTNGEHNESAVSARYASEALRFFEHFVARRTNGWLKTPRVQIWHEDRVGTDEPS
jgi:putative CocE/NonD family hydrolase